MVVVVAYGYMDNINIVCPEYTVDVQLSVSVINSITCVRHNCRKCLSFAQLQYVRYISFGSYVSGACPSLTSHFCELSIATWLVQLILSFHRYNFVHSGDHYPVINTWSAIRNY